MKTMFVSLAILVVVSAGGVRAQTPDVAGVRARGMGGAFTAVADDASAAWWNPAGLAGGAYASAVIEYGRLDSPAGEAGRPGSAGGFAAGFPALGVSYYRFRISEMQRSAPTAAASPSRQDGGVAGTGLLAVTVSQLGATVGQSLGDHLVVGTTVKWVHGGPDRVGATDAATLDLGAMASFGRARLGMTVRNVTEPTLGEAETVALERTARAGASFAFGPAGVFDAVTIAADADLTTNAGMPDAVRHASGGAEAWLLKRRLALRGGVVVNTTGNMRPSGSAGVSVALRSGVYLDGAVIEGDDRSVGGWGAALRVTF